LKTESLLQGHRVAHTIIVFGNTRIPEPQAARWTVEAYSKAFAASPSDVALNWCCGRLSPANAMCCEGTSIYAEPSQDAQLYGVHCQGEDHSRSSQHSDNPDWQRSHDDAEHRQASNQEEVATRCDNHDWRRPGVPQPAPFAQNVNISLARKSKH